MGIGNRVLIFLSCSAALFAQHEIAETNERVGEQLYIANCLYCHGPEGDQVPGIDLQHGHFKHASTDDGIVHIILNGIPGTGMPAQTKMPIDSARSIVAYLRARASVASAMPKGGDAGRGKAIFENKGRCLNCHTRGEEGSGLGPDLSDIGSLRRPDELEKILADPEGTMLPQNRIFRAVKLDGTTITGRILNQDTFTVQLIDSHDRLISLDRSALREFSPVRSPMPSYKDKLSSAEMADLVTYLVSLKGVR